MRITHCYREDLPAEVTGRDTTVEENVEQEIEIADALPAEEEGGDGLTGSLLETFFGR